MPKVRIGILALFTVCAASVRAAETPTEEGGTEAPAAALLEYGIPVEGTFAPGDAALQDVVAGNDGDTTFTDTYDFDSERGHVIRLSVESSVAVYLALLSPDGTLLAGDGVRGDQLQAQVLWEVERRGTYTVAVNAFHGEVGQYSVSLAGAAPDEVVAASEEPPTVPPPHVLSPNLRVSPELHLGGQVEGMFAEGDLGLEVLIPANAGDATYADGFRFRASAGDIVSLNLMSDVTSYLALLNSDGQLVAGDGIRGDQTTTRIVRLLPTAGEYAVVANSYHGAEGTYVLSLSPATEADIQSLSNEMPVDGILTSDDLLSGRIEVDERIFRTYVVDVPPSTEELTIHTRSDDNVDLFVRYGLQILQSYNVEPDFRSDGPDGDEAVRINAFTDPPLREGRYFIDVAALIPAEARTGTGQIPFEIMASLAESTVVVADAPPLEDEDVIVGAFGSDLTGGDRVAARIDPALSPVQIWPVLVPPGAERLEVRTYGATGRLDVIATPPGMNLPTSTWDFFTVPHRAITAADNERLVVDTRTLPPIRPGLYTIAVFDLASGDASDYRIEAAIDATLSGWPVWTDGWMDDYDELSVLQRAALATVQLSLSVGEEGGSSGSGTLLTSDGLILTNHHIIGECNEGSSYLYGCAGQVYRYPDGRPVNVYVGLANGFDSTAQQHFVAQVIRTDPDRDLALLQILSDLDGRPLSAPLPTMPLATSGSAVATGDAISAIGYPGVAGIGSRIRLSLAEGSVNGFTDDQGERVLANVDASVARGNAGGALVRNDGVLVAVPSNTHVRYDLGERQGFARTLNLLPPDWIDLLAAHGADLR